MDEDFDTIEPTVYSFERHGRTIAEALKAFGFSEAFFDGQSVVTIAAPALVRRIVVMTEDAAECAGPIA